MATKNKHVDVEMLDDVEMKPTVCLRAGQSFVSVKPLFSHDGKYIFIVSGSIIKVFSATGGGCVRELRGHQQRITDICLNPKNKLQILSCSTDGWVKQWDYSDGVTLRKFNLNVSLFGIICLPHSTKLEVAVIKSFQGREGYQLVKYVLSDWGDGGGPAPTVLINSCSNSRKTVALGAEDEFIAAVGENHLSVYSFKRNKLKRFENKSSCFTCVACHPTEQCIVIGDAGGKIHYWWNFNRPEKLVKSYYHWHSLPVKCLEFTNEGSTLLSGGHECVLVKWQYNTNVKDFLPRLGSPLNHVTCSPDNTIYALAQDDNAVKLISNTFVAVSFFQGLTRGHLNSHVKNQESTGLLYDPHTKAIVTNGRPGHLQFYNVHTDTQLFNLDIVGQNYISPDTLSKETITQVTQAAFNYSGKWLATTEYWSAENLSPEIRLKFWVFCDEKQKYVLNTSVEFPHDEAVHCLKFRPQHVSNKDLLMVVTTSKDGCFKLWSAADSTDIYGTITKWMCETSSTYRDLPAGQAAFTQDASLLAVVFKSTVTLWDPDTNELKAALHANMGDFIVNHIAFGKNNSGHYLVTASNQHITSWNLLSLSAHWTVNLRVDVLVADPFSTYMAAFSTDRNLFVFDPSKSEPVYTHSSVSLSPVIAAVFIPHLNKGSGEERLSWQKFSQLYFMNENQQLSTVDYPDNQEKEQSSQLSITQKLPKTPFGQLMAEKTVRDAVRMNTDIEFSHKTDKFVRQILQTSPHVQPPVTVFCKTFLQSLLKSHKTSKSNEEVKDNEDDEEQDFDQHDSDSEEDLDEKISKHKTKEVDMEIDTEEKQDVEKESAAIAQTMTEQFSWFSIKG